MEIKNIRYHGFINVKDVWYPFDKIIPTTNENPFEDIQKTLKQLGIEHYLITYEEV